jgi:hypothetical protein
MEQELPTPPSESDIELSHGFDKMRAFLKVEEFEEPRPIQSWSLKNLQLEKTTGVNLADGENSDDSSSLPQQYVEMTHPAPARSGGEATHTTIERDPTSSDNMSHRSLKSVKSAPERLYEPKVFYLALRCCYNLTNTRIFSLRWPLWMIRMKCLLFRLNLNQIPNQLVMLMSFFKNKHRLTKNGFKV